MTFLAIFHITLAVLLIVLVLLQDSKGGALGVFGAGSSSSVFGSSGGSDFLTKATKWLAILFSATCILLAYTTTKKQESVLDKITPPAQTDIQKQDTPAKTDMEQKNEGEDSSSGQ